MTKISIWVLSSFAALVAMSACDFKCTVGQSGCSTDALVKTFNEKAQNAGRNITDFKCTKPDEWKAGATFQCAGQENGKAVVWAVTVQDDKCNVDYKMIE